MLLLLPLLLLLLLLGWRTPLPATVASSAVLTMVAVRS